MADVSQIVRMPRGGQDASWMDRQLQTSSMEYTDRYDVPDHVKQSVVRALDWVGERFGGNDKIARLAVSLVKDIGEPPILELGAGHGKLSAAIVRLYPRARVTVTDLDPTWVRNIAAGPLGSHPRVKTRVADATAIC